jgi:nijmegen breakage syndrome protein 1
VQKRREEEEVRAREDAENLKEALDGMELKGPANFVEIEEMQISRSHSAHVSKTTSDRSERWDEKWNDRPNFKRFRRQGSERLVGRRQKNFVPMEETKRKDFGIGEEYWLESGSKQKESRKSQRESQLQTQTLRDSSAKRASIDEEEEGDNTQFRRRPRNEKPVEDEDEVQIVEESLTQASRKRVARESPAEKPPPPKKVAVAPVRKKIESESEDEDALAFPRRRGGTARKR